MKKVRRGVLTQGNAWGSNNGSSSSGRVSEKSSSSYNPRTTNDGRGEGQKVHQVKDASRRFEEACAIMRQNAQKFIGDGVEYDSSASEDELDDSSIIKKTLQEYNGTGALELLKTQEILQDSLTSGALVCLICIESIKRNNSIWSCNYCHCMFHLDCIQKWAKDSMFHQSSTGDNAKNENLKWCCPKCRYEYKPSEKPTKYLCFCGKVEDPQFDPWNVPHSCGRSCEKFLKPQCGHTCALLCHPGPCPPCPQTIEVACYCLKSRPTVRRCSTKEWSCGKPCGKLLSCNQHHCKEPCHAGDCPMCLKQSEQTCECGSEKTMRPCNNPAWQCDKVCTKPLECGNHWCSIKCHAGECSPCPKSGARPCPCKKKIVWIPCTEEVAPCGDTCDRLLECDLHKCSQRCHFGSCGACLQMRVMKCRCMQREKSVPCCKEYLCDFKCKRRRDCGRHNCNKKCCVGGCPPCEAPCGRTLNCGSHKCSSRCHPGPCYPCRETTSITCNCGITKISMPCGRKKSAVPPRCSANCILPADCHHEERHKHRCHFGACPPCRLKCEKDLGCGHLCPYKCHSAVLTKIETNKKKEGPWDLANSYKMELVCKACPPCQVPIPVTCLGKHEIINLPCAEVRPISCGRKCGKLLLCENHQCQKECHEVPDSSDVTTKTGSPPCQSCEELCAKPRHPDCSHACKRRCHPGECHPCSEMLKMSCHCQLMSLYVRCDEWSVADAEKREELMSCKNRCPKEMSCGHRCIQTCHEGPCADRKLCKKKVTLRCPCKRQKKDVQCHTQIKYPSTLECDETCLRQQEEARALQLEEEEKKKMEEEKRQEQEMEEYRRKTEGKKKRRRRVAEVEEEDGWLREHVMLLLAFLVSSFAFVIFGYVNLYR